MVNCSSHQRAGQHGLVQKPLLISDFAIADHAQPRSIASIITVRREPLSLSRRFLGAHTKLLRVSHNAPFPQPDFVHLDFHGPPLDAAFRYGRAFAPVYHAVRERSLHALGALNRITPQAMTAQAQVWLGTLPPHFRDQLAALAAGAGTPVADMATLLYADISSPSANPAALCSPAELASGTDPRDRSIDGRTIDTPGPLCSTVVSPLINEHRPWVARNCDWYPETLWRGTCSVLWRNPGPGRIPSLALGIMGDIDCDTGANAAGLWLHMHTQYATDLPRPGKPAISWLFWMRECLETCATLEEVERFVAEVDRDRGVLLIAVHGPSGAAAVFQCTRGAYTRIEPADGSDPLHGPPGTLVVTNHCRHQQPRQSEAERRALGISKPNSTVRRYNRLLELLHAHPPEHGPDDLIDLLADDDVEMRTAPSLRTIYSAVACPQRHEVYFASGAVPAASAGTWRRIPLPW